MKLNDMCTVRYTHVANKASLHSKQGFFTMQTSLLCGANKACLKRRANKEVKDTADFGFYSYLCHADATIGIH